MSSLYRDAIADARKLREAAEQNAKNRIIDAVTPKLRQLIEAQINEEDDLLDDDMAGDTDLVSTDDFVDLLQDEEPDTVAPAEPMDLDMGSMDIESDGLGSLEIKDDSADISLDMADGFDDDEESSSEEEETNVNINITVEGKRNYLLRHRAIRLVKKLSEAKTRSERRKIRQELRILRQGLIITENSQNKRLANNLSVILKETNMRRKSRSWLFEGDDELDMSMDDAPETDDSDDGTIEIDAGKLEDALGLDPGTLSGESSDDADDLDMDLGDDDDDDSDDAGDETYEYGGMKEGEKADELDQCETDDADDGQVVEIHESMLRRALRTSRRRRTSRGTSKLSESRRARIARARRRRRIMENDAAAAAPSFGGGSAEDEMFVDVDENTLLNALAEELGGGEENSSGAAGSASAAAGDFGGGDAKGDVFESRSIRRAKRQTVLAERKARAATAELKESNLFNAKLLYVTKLMQQHELNNKQQRAIIEAMDNAKTQREAKLLFTSLNESLNKKSANKLNESKKNTINESRNAYSNRSLQSGQAPRGNGVELDRWAILAGIKK